MDLLLNKKAAIHSQDSQCSTPAELSDDAGSVASAYDVEAVITDFLADKGRSTLSLPGLTAVQRKQAKKLAEQHPSIRCESFGFGTDRTLILFKQDEPETKATDIEAVGDSAAATDSNSSNSNSSNSNSNSNSALPSLSLQLAASDEAVAAVAAREECSSNASTCTSGQNGATACPRLPSSSWSSTRSSHSPSRIDSSLEGADAILPLPKGLQVHNTFICGDEDIMSYDQRSTQSMPHGMFRRSLLRELQESQLQDGVEEEEVVEAVVSTSTCTELEAQPELKAVVAESGESGSLGVQLSFEPGMEVVIDGLLRAPAFNGQHGTVQSFDAEVGRYDILLRSPCPVTGQQWAKVRAENLVLVKFPEPPKHAPTLEVNRAVLSADALAGGSPVSSSAASPVPEASQRSPPSQAARPEVLLQEWSAWEASRQCYGEQSYATFYPAQMMTYA